MCVRSGVPMIEFRTLGEVALTAGDGRELRSVLAQPKRLALLAYLASPRTPGFVPREVLLGLFWPEREEERARHALRTSLHFLRRSLGPDVLVSRGEQDVGLDAARLRCDVTGLEAVLDAHEDARVLDLYGGEYLPGLVVGDALGFERWLEGERRRLRLRARDAARRLAATALARGDGAEAERRARRAMALDPWDEATLQLLMRTLAGRGNRAGAVRIYERFAERLREELGLEPSSATDALASRIRTVGGMARAERSEASLVADGHDVPGAPAEICESTAATEASAAGSNGEVAPKVSSPARVGRPTFSRRWLEWSVGALFLVAVGAILAYRSQRAVSIASGVGLSGSTPTGGVESIAVLPLENLSPDSADAYLAGAMTDALTSALSVVPGFSVPSRTSASRFTGSARAALRPIAESLGVRYLVEGDVVRVGDSLAVTTRLVDSRGGRTVWAGRFARPVREALHIQVDIAREVAASLRSSFTKEDEERIEAGQSADPVVRSLYLRGKSLVTPGLLDSATAERAAHLLRRAVSLDTAFAAAWLRLGRAYQWTPAGSDSSRLAYDRAIREAKPPWLKAYYRSIRAEYASERDSALAYAQEAVKLDAGNPQLVWNLAQAFKWRQDLPNALLWELKARDLDPLNPDRWCDLGNTYTGLYMDQRAERAFRRAIAIDPAEPDGFVGLQNLRMLQGDYRAALAFQDTVDALEGVSDNSAIRGELYLWMGQTARGRRLLEKALKTWPWTDIVWAAPEIVRARLATGDTAGADSLAHRATATLRRVAAVFKLSPAMPSSLVDLAAVQGDGALASKRLRGYLTVGTLRMQRWFLADPDYGAVRSDTALGAVLAALRSRIMEQRREALVILDANGGG